MRENGIHCELFEYTICQVRGGGGGGTCIQCTCHVTNISMKIFVTLFWKRLTQKEATCFDNVMICGGASSEVNIVSYYAEA